MQENVVENNERELSETLDKFLAKPVVKNMKTLQALKYGYMDIVQHKESQDNTFFSQYFDVFAKNPYPQVYDTYHEIQGLKRTQKKVMNNPNFKNAMKFIIDCDRSIHKVFEREFKKIGVRYNGDFLQGIQDELGALVLKLKRHYNRPRPYQFAYYGKQNFHPFNTTSGHSPAYPSGHSCQAHFLMEVMAFRVPTKARQLKQLGQRIADTRIDMGVHYPSDNKFGKEIALTLKKIPEVRERYFNKR